MKLTPLSFKYVKWIDNLRVGDMAYTDDGRVMRVQRIGYNINDIGLYFKIFYMENGDSFGFNGYNDDCRLMFIEENNTDNKCNYINVDYEYIINNYKDKMQIEFRINKNNYTTPWKKYNIHESSIKRFFELIKSNAEWRVCKGE